MPTRAVAFLAIGVVLLCQGVAHAEDRPNYPKRGYVTGVRTAAGEFQALLESQPPSACGSERSPTGNVRNLVLTTSDPLHRQMLVGAMQACVSVDFSDSFAAGKWKLIDLQILRSQSVKDSNWGL
jgi:hypothetical protein